MRVSGVCGCAFVVSCYLGVTFKFSVNAFCISHALTGQHWRCGLRLRACDFADHMTNLCTFRTAVCDRCHTIMKVSRP